MTGDSQKNKWPELAHSTIVAADKKVGDGDEDDRTQRCRSQRIPEASAEDTQLDKNPSADKGANDSQDDVRDAAETAAARDFSCEPASDQSDENPIQKSTWKHRTEVPRANRL